MRRRQAIAVLALAGLFVALYLWFYKLGIVGELRCGGGGCETVQASPFAALLGLPVALYGVVGYAALLGLALAATRPAALARRGFDVALALLASLGFAFTLYLTGLELFVIHATCRWCVGSAAIITAIWLLALSALPRAT
jgi:uncharacterized membrane protein